MELLWARLILGRGKGDPFLSSGLSIILSVSRGESQVNPNETAAAPSPRGLLGGGCIRGFFRVHSAQPPPWARSLPMMVKPMTFLSGFPADREILFTYFIKENSFFFFLREGNKPSLGKTESWMPLMRRASKVPLSEPGVAGSGYLLAAQGGSCLGSQREPLASS